VDAEGKRGPLQHDRVERAESAWATGKASIVLPTPPLVLKTSTLRGVAIT